MKNNVLAVLGFAAALVMAAPAMAQTSAGGYYIGATVGQATSSDFCGNAGSPCKDQDTSWRLLGGYQINRYLGIEAGFHNLGASSNPAGPNDAKAQAMELLGVASYAFTSDWSVYGKAGVYRGRLRGSTAAGASFNESNTDLTFGLGVQWNILEQLGLRAELQRYPKMGGGNAGASADYDVWSVGAVFKFQ